MGSEKVEERIPWFPLIVLSGFLSFLAAASFRLLAPLGGQWQCGYSFGIISRVTCVAVYPYLLLTLAYPLRRLFKVTPNTLTYLYTAGLAVSFTLGFGFMDYAILFSRPRLYDNLGLLQGVWWEPSVEAVAAMVKGGVATDWAQWGPIVFVISLLYISFWFFTSSVVLIFRRSWIDIDMIPFPLTITGYEVLRAVQAEGLEGKPKRRTPFFVGFLLAFMFMVPVFMARTFPWFPDIYAWRITCPSNAVHAQEGDIIGSTIVWYSGYSKDPIAVAIFLLAPVGTSFNVWFWSLIILILEQVAYFMGYHTGALGQSGWVKLCCPDETTGVATTAPFYWPIFSMAGGFLALTVMYIFLHRGYVVETLRLALHGNPELEKKEAMSYRSMYIMLMVSAIASIISLVILGINFLSALIILLTSCFTTWFAMTLILGTSGFGASDNRMWAVTFMRIIWPDPSIAPTNLDYVMSHLWAQNGANVATYGFGNGFFTTALALKMSSLTGTSNRNTFLVAAVCTVVAVPILFATSVWLANLYGSRVLTWGACSIQTMCESSPEAQAARPPTLTYVSYTAMGFLWTVLLSVLRARFVWFPFDPVGFIIAASFSGMWNHVWSVFLTAWIIKTIVLRVGGSPLYENYIVPGVGGFIGGVALASMIGIVTGMVRFYIPF